jgi:cytochrome c-type biogenesis protein CcmF
MPMTEAAIDAGFCATCMSRSASRSTSGAWSVRVYYKPFVDWIWGGCLLMALGGFIAMLRPALPAARQGSAAHLPGGVPA